jgi:hypothetical protein
MVRFTLNAAIFPADPKVALKVMEANFGATGELQKAGILTDIGTFNPGEGYMIVEFPSLEAAYTLAERWYPHMSADVREIIPWEKTEEIAFANRREQVR